MILGNLGLITKENMYIHILGPFMTNWLLTAILLLRSKRNFSQNPFELYSCTVCIRNQNLTRESFLLFCLLKKNKNDRGKQKHHDDGIVAPFNAPTFSRLVRFRRACNSGRLRFPGITQLDWTGDRRVEKNVFQWHMFFFSAAGFLGSLFHICFFFGICLFH